MCVKSKLGFTLIELMIIVTIIGILAMIAMPAFSRSRTRTRLTMCKNNQRVIFDQMNVYCFNTGLPSSSDTFPTMGSCRDTLVPADPVMRYIKTRKAFACPENPDQNAQQDYSWILDGRSIIGIHCDILGDHNH